MLPGAAVSAVAWQLLLTGAGVIVAHQLRHAQAIAGLFGVVLTGASPQPDAACRWSPLFWGLRSAGEDRDRRAGTVYEPS
jgi:hypothetical protein